MEKEKQEITKPAKKRAKKKDGFREKMREVRLRVVWTVARFLVSPFIRQKFAYAYDKSIKGGPYLILCNHNTDWDPLLLGMAFPQRVSFVASEHIFRKGVVSKLLRFAVDPISRLKGTVALNTVREIVDKLKSGINVAIFAEGNRSFNGLTGDIPESIGKLARLCGVSVVTYRLDGGYLTSPRWSRTIRRGKMKGSVVRIYPAEEVRKMKPEELNESIRADLSLDAMKEQRTHMIRFRGKRLAEHLENVLCLCPKCGQIGKLQSREDRLFCDCGFSVRYNEFGFFEGEDAPFDNITDWDNDQTEKLIASLPEGDGCIFSDTEMVMKEVFPDHSEKVVGKGEMRLFRDRLECCGKIFPLSRIGGFALRGPQAVNLGTDSGNYEIVSDNVRCTRKYMTVIRYLQGLNTSAAKA